MNRDEWRQAIEEVPVFDTHTHLNMPGVPVSARDFWDIAHYFWFLEELWSVGYPRDAVELPEAQRIERFVRAYAATRNTAWHQTVHAMFRTLYGIDLGDAASVRQADAAVRESHRQAGWSRRVIDRLAIARIAVNTAADASFPELPGVGVAVPGADGDAMATWTERILHAGDQRATGREAQAGIAADVSSLHEQGIRGMRVEIEPLERLGRDGLSMPDDLHVQGAGREQIDAFLIHALLRALGTHGMFAQLFLGIRRNVASGTAMGVDDPERIVRLYPLFERHACGFELVIGAPGGNMDAAQPARIYPNVHLGGLWWYNFRSSTYRHAMQVRLEAVPASKAALVASDARCIEWCYGKILLVKRLLADFLADQVDRGWLGREDAMWAAREWLHDAAARRYLPASR
jgi:hypothetical protein